MIRINLLPVRAARRREAVARHLVLFLVGLVILIAAGLFMYSTDSRRLGDVQRANDVLLNDIEDLKKIIGEVDEYKAEERALSKKMGVIEDLRAKKTGPVRMLDRVASDIPDKLWLTELEEQDQKVTLKGVSINNEVIATFMSRLEDSPLFAEVYLVSIERESIDDLNLKRFTITSKLTVNERAEAGKEG
jgi:type IV pilus assembly protein PilN